MELNNRIQLHLLLGEGHKEEMIDFVGSAIEVYEDQIKSHPLPISPGETLHCSYPTKVLADDGVLVISDSGLHKVFILSLNNLEVMVGFQTSSFIESKISDLSLFGCFSYQHAIRSCRCIHVNAT